VGELPEPESERIMRREQIWIFSYLCITIGALVLLAAGLPQLSFRPGRSFALNGGQAQGGASDIARPGAGDISFWRVLFALIFLALLVYFVIAVIFSAQLRREVLRRIAAGLVAVLLFYMLFSALRGGSPQLAPQATGTPQPPPPVVGEPPPAFVAQPSQGLVVAVSLALAALLLAGIWFFWRRARTPERESPLAALAREALADIEAGGDVHDTVLRCYLEMNRVLSEQRGVERQRAMTPREFERYLAASGLHDEHIRRLTRLFEGARYGARRPGEREEREAVACLTAIVRVYGRSS
jgi:hypothetical protein